MTTRKHNTIIAVTAILAIMIITVSCMWFKHSEPEYKFELLDQSRVKIESKTTVDTIKFNDLEEWIENDNL